MSLHKRGDRVAIGNVRHLYWATLVAAWVARYLSWLNFVGKTRYPDRLSLWHHGMTLATLTILSTILQANIKGGGGARFAPAFI